MKNLYKGWEECKLKENADRYMKVWGQTDIAVGKKGAKNITLTQVNEEGQEEEGRERKGHSPHMGKGVELRPKKVKLK